MTDAEKDTKASLTPDAIARLEELKGILSNDAVALTARQKAAGDKVRERTKADLGRLSDAHLLTCGVLAGVLRRTSGLPMKRSAATEERMVLFASFVVGLPLFEQAIEEGRYLQAMALVRQAMETLAQLVGSHHGRRVPGKTVPVNILGTDIARAYGDLSAAAHNANHDLASGLLTREMREPLLPGASRARFFFPVENKGLARQAFALHLVLLMNLIGQAALDYNKAYSGGGFGPRDKEALDLAAELMRAEGVLDSAPKTAQEAGFL